MPDEKKIVSKNKVLDPKDVTTCKATSDMLIKARLDGDL